MPTILKLSVKRFRSVCEPYVLLCIVGRIAIRSTTRIKIREISAIDHKQFQNWVSGIDGLSPPQREQTQDLLSGVTDENASLITIEAQLAETRQCPHCNTAGAVSRGMARGLRRYQCKACKKIFNAATGTGFATGPSQERQVAHLWGLPR